MRTHLARVRLVLLLACVLGLPALQGGFLGDDLNILLGLEKQGIVGFALQGRGLHGPLPFWRPLAFSLLGLERWLFAWTPLGYLLISILLYLVCIRVTSLLYQRWMSPRAALVATALFALHPRHLEASAWISAQPDLLATLGISLALFALAPSARVLHRRHIVLALLAGVLALGAKESALSLVPLATWLGYRWWMAEATAAPPATATHASSSDTGMPAASIGGRCWIRMRSSGLPAALLALGALTLVYVLARGYLLGDWLAGYGASVHLRPSLLGVLKPLLSFTANLLLPIHLHHADALLEPYQLLLSRSMPVLVPVLVLVLAGIGVRVAYTRRSRPVRIASEPAQDTASPRPLPSQSKSPALGLLPQSPHKPTVRPTLARDHLLTWGVAYLLCLFPYFNLAVGFGGRSDRYLLLPALFFCPLLASALEPLLLARVRGITMAPLLLALLLGSFSAGRVTLALTYRQAGIATTRIMGALLEQLPSLATQRVYLVGVPDQLEGVGMLFTGLPRWLQAQAEVQGHAELEVIIAARVRLKLEDSTPVRWRLETGSGGIRVVGLGGGLYPGGEGMPGWGPAMRAAQTAQASLSLPYDGTGTWWALEDVLTQPTIRTLRPAPQTTPSD